MAVQSISKIIKTALRKGGDKYCLVERDTEELEFLSAFTSQLDFFAHFVLSENGRPRLLSDSRFQFSNGPTSTRIQNQSIPAEAVLEFHLNCAKTMQLLQISAGNYLFQQGENVHSAYIVLNGKMMITSNDSRGFAERANRNGKAPGIIPGRHMQKEMETLFNSNCITIGPGDSIGGAIIPKSQRPIPNS